MIAELSRRATANDPLLDLGIPLVEAIARQLKARFGRVLSFEDMVSRGNEGLVDALIRFEPARGVEFKAFASQRIRGAIVDGMRSEASLSRRAYERVRQERDESLFDCQIGPAEFDETLLGEWSSETDSPEELATRAQETAALLDILDELQPAHAELVRRFYCEGDTLQEISEDLGYAPGWGSKAMPVVIEAIRRRVGGLPGAPGAGGAPILKAPRSLDSARACSIQGSQEPRRQGGPLTPTLPGASVQAQEPSREAPRSIDQGGHPSPEGSQEPVRVPNEPAPKLPGASIIGVGGRSEAPRSLLPPISAALRGSQEPFSGSYTSIRGSGERPGSSKRPCLPRDQKSTSPCRLHAIGSPLCPIGPSETRGAHRTAQLKRSVMNDIELVNAILAARNVSTAAYERYLHEFLAMERSKVRVLNVDALTVVPRVLGAVPKILAMVDQIADEAPRIPIDRLKKLEGYTYAFQEAHIRYVSTGKAPDELRALGAQGDLLRTVLASDARALVIRGLIDGSRFDACTGQSGYRAIAFELGVYAEVLLSCKDKIEGKSGVTVEELKRAQAIAEALLAYVGVREQSPEARAAAMDIRDRAFTTMADTYDIGRRVATFLRWNEGDADELVPSLYGGKRKRTEEEEKKELSPSDTTPANTTPANNVAPAAPAPVAGNTQVNAAVGRPNSNPFMQ